jgi:hypothetical protein
MYRAYLTFAHILRRRIAYLHAICTHNLKNNGVEYPLCSLWDQPQYVENVLRTYLHCSAYDSVL